jgi:hypothetical protein
MITSVLLRAPSPDELLAGIPHAGTIVKADVQSQFCVYSRL